VPLRRPKHAPPEPFAAPFLPNPKHAPQASSAARSPTHHLLANLGTTAPEVPGTKSLARTVGSALLDLRLQSLAPPVNSVSKTKKLLSEIHTNRPVLLRSLRRRVPRNTKKEQPFKTEPTWSKKQPILTGSDLWVRLRPQLSGPLLSSPWLLQASLVLCLVVATADLTKKSMPRTFSNGGGSQFLCWIVLLVQSSGAKHSFLLSLRPSLLSLLSSLSLSLSSPAHALLPKVPSDLHLFCTWIFTISSTGCHIITSLSEHIVISYYASSVTVTTVALVLKYAASISIPHCV